MEIYIANELGFCFGVKRAYSLAIEAGSKKTAIMGQLVHNQDVQNSIYKTGVKEYAPDIEVDTLILRSHGTLKSKKEKLSKRYKLIDTTCPVLVAIYKQMIRHEEEGYLNVLVGQKSHPEVQATASQVKECVIIESTEDINNITWNKPIYLTVQTTLNTTLADTIIDTIKDIASKHDFQKPLKINYSVCNASHKRRAALYELMEKTDCILIFGGPNSNNTKELVSILEKENFPHFFGNSIFSLDLSQINKYNRVGISAGASTPDWIIKEAVRVLNELNNEKQMNEEQTVETTEVVSNEAVEEKTDEVVTSHKEVNEEPASEEVSAAEAKETDENNEMMQQIDDTFTRIRRGQITNGKVLYVTENQIMVNINYRSDGIIDRDELPEDVTDPREHYNTGDELDVYIVKVDDGDGNVVLSLRRIKDVKVWNELEEYFESKKPLEIQVKETTKGGLIVEYKGARAFMPGSQAYARFRRDLSGLVGQTVEAELIDFDKSKRRAIFSRRELEKAKIDKQQEEFWSGIEEGQLRKGTVQRLTNFGAFVDLGGVDGLIHVTDLAWNRVKDPKDVLSVGDEVEVLVLGFDKEKQRVSLGLKQTTEEPWKKFINNNKVGDVVKGTVVTMPDFGAFVRLPEGVDGLLHISQICKEHIEKPSDVLNIGQEVEAKIIDIKDDQKISLSIRALTEPIEREPKERKPRRERAPRREEESRVETVEQNPIDNPLIDSEILGELKKMAQETTDQGSEEESTQE
ncbi:MAG: 30S ribosomal protein S1 [Tissierellia bacterium]|nr:30S ribosomal protein S1 [Tissierellia bacterium]